MGRGSGFLDEITRLLFLAKLSISYEMETEKLLFYFIGLFGFGLIASLSGSGVLRFL